MADREKVIVGLAEISEHMRQVAEKSEDPMLRGMFDYWHEMAEGALTLLREQEQVKRHPRVMTLEEVQDALDTVVWLDDGDENTSGNYALVEFVSYNGAMTAVWFKLMDRAAGQQRRHYESYGKRWRCWDIRPTDEQRKAVKWDD